MLWWFIGAWLASGTVLPALLLLRWANRWLATSKIGPKGSHALSGAAGFGIGALVLWFVCSLSDSSIAMRDTPSASTVAQASTKPTERAEAKPVDADIEASAVRLVEADAAIQPRIGAFGQSAGDNGHQTDAAVPQALLTAPLHTKLGMRRGLAHDARWPSVGPYITHSSSSGTWLFTPHDGGNG
jgi:hypothetical protein